MCECTVSGKSLLPELERYYIVDDFLTQEVINSKG